MAINVSFNGATIYKPGAYSEVEIDLGGGFPLSPTGLVAIFGESSTGTPGADEVDIANVVFSPEQLPQIVAKYGPGNIADVASFLFAPGADGAIPGGAQSVYIYKTNASTQASFAMPVAGSEQWGTLEALAYGTKGNLITYQNLLVPETPAFAQGSVVVPPSTANFAQGDILNIAVNGLAPIPPYTILASVNVAALLAQLNGAFPALTWTQNASNQIVATMNAAPSQYELGWARSMEIQAGSANAVIGLTVGLYSASSEPMMAIQVNDTGSLVIESATIGGQVVLDLGFQSDASDATSASVDINATNIVLTVAGGAQAGVKTLALAGFNTINQLVSAINILPKVNGHGWVAAVASSILGQQNPSSLDEVSSVGALSNDGLLPAGIKNDAASAVNFFNLSSEVELVLAAGQGVVGLPAPQTEVALTGGSLGGTSTAAIVNALTQFQTIRVNSIVPLFSRDATADIADGLTDPTSNYTIAGIHQAVKTHLSLMSTTKNRSERQGYLSFKGSYADVKTVSGVLADARIQLSFQDINQVNSQGGIQWFQPWAGSALLAGARGGSPAGTPMTHKYFNCSGIRQTGQPMSTPEQDIVIDFNPELQYDDAIINGLTFWEAPQTGGFRLVVDNTTYGADANWVYNRANVLYAADVIVYDFRNQMESIYVGVKNTVSAAEIKSTAASILNTYLAQGLTVSTSDAQQGYKQLIVQLNGNTVNISVTLKLVEGIDFILANFTLQRATATA